MCDVVVLLHASRLGPRSNRLRSRCTLLSSSVASSSARLLLPSILLPLPLALLSLITLEAAVELFASSLRPLQPIPTNADYAKNTTVDTLKCRHPSINVECATATMGSASPFTGPHCHHLQCELHRHCSYSTSGD